MTYKTIHSILHVCGEGVHQAYKTIYSILHVCEEGVHQAYKTIHSILHVCEEGVNEHPYLVCICIDVIEIDYR